VRLLPVIAVVTVSVLAFGYWHSSTHATFYATLKVEEITDQRPTFLPEAKIQFLDSNGKILANGVRDQQHNYIHLVHPTYGDCHEVEKMAVFSKEARTSWQACFEHQSVWIAGWIRDVDTVNVKFGNCLIQNSPILVSRSNSDWYLWWVPHPHIGGKPYSDYTSMMRVYEKDCVEKQQ
jgi:hypothetical protein